MAVYGEVLVCVVVVRVEYSIMEGSLLVEVFVVVVLAVVEVGLVPVGCIVAYKGWLVERSIGVEGLEGDGM